MRKLIYLPLVLIALSACQNSVIEETLLGTIDAIEADLKKLDYLDTTIASNLAEAYNAFIEIEGQDSLKPLYHLKLAELYRHWPGMEVKAIETLEEVEERYTYHEVAARALLNLGLFYEELGQKDRAIASYKEFIERFPSHSMATQARDLMEMLSESHVTDIERVQNWKKNSEKK